MTDDTIWLAYKLTFRRLGRADFPLLRDWLAQPHMARWWNQDSAPEAIEADFGAIVDGADPTDMFIVMAEKRPLGLVQRYLFGDNREYIAELASLVVTQSEALSIDYLVGEPDLLRRGVGAAMIRECVTAIWRDYPSAPAVIVPVNAANKASWRVLERLASSGSPKAHSNQTTLSIIGRIMSTRSIDRPDDLT